MCVCMCVSEVVAGTIDRVGHAYNFCMLIQLQSCLMWTHAVHKLLLHKAVSEWSNAVCSNVQHCTKYTTIVIMNAVLILLCIGPFVH